VASTADTLSCQIISELKTKHSLRTLPSNDEYREMAQLRFDNLTLSNNIPNFGYLDSSQELGSDTVGYDNMSDR
jgi:hypothetical protein